MVTKTGMLLRCGLARVLRMLARAGRAALRQKNERVCCIPAEVIYRKRKP